MGCAVLAAVWIAAAASPPDEVKITSRERSVFTAKVTDRKFQNNSNILELRDIEISEDSHSKNPIIKNNRIHGILAYLNADENKMPYIGQRIRISGIPEVFEKARNPGQFDMAAYRRIHGLDFAIKDARIEARGRFFDRIGEACKSFQESSSEIYDRLMPKEDAGVCKAVVVGNKTELDSGIKSLYQRVGIAHILSISALHISILGLGLYKLLKMLHVPRIIAAFACCIFLILYSLVCGGAASAVRAIIMFMLFLAAEQLGRSYDLLSAMMCSLLFLLLTNPLISRDTGFLLSFGAVSGIGILNPLLSEIVPLSKNKIISGILCSISVTLFTLPVTLSSFYQIPLSSFLLNIVIIPLMGIFMCMALGVLAFAYLHLRVPAEIFAKCCSLLLGFFENCARAGDVSSMRLVVGKPELLRILIYYSLLFIMLTVVRELKSTGRKRIITAIFIFFMLGIMTVRVRSGLSYMMLDIGQGSCSLLRAGSGSVIMVDCGSSDIKEVAKYRVIPCLRSMGIGRIDYAFVTHSDADHVNGFEEMMTMEKAESVPIKHLVLPCIRNPDDNYRKLETLARKSGIEILYIYEGKMMEEGKLKIKCLHPYRDFEWEDVNAYSTVLDVRYGSFSVLLTGDLVGDGEDEVQKKMGSDYSILQVAHHGSRFSSMESFLAKASPRISLVSSGVNNSYSHPHKETLERLAKINTKVYMTKENGAITVRTDGRRIKLNTFLKGRTNEE